VGFLTRASANSVQPGATWSDRGKRVLFHVITGLISFCRRAMVALLAFLFPALYEPDKRYHPELHYMRGPGPKCRAKYLADRSSIGER
jgi:hypothetical protein